MNLMTTLWFFHSRMHTAHTGNDSNGIHQYRVYSRRATPSAKMNNARMIYNLSLFLRR
jgi:hypothetical protein